MPLNLPPPTGGVSDELRAPQSTALVPRPSFEESGFIIPPPELRAIVDKTASFVARVGSQFESKIRDQERANPKFAFLYENDPYNKYYQKQVELARQGATSAAQAAAPPGDEAAAASGSASAAGPSTAAAAVQEAVTADRQTEVIQGPPPEPTPHEFLLDFPNIPAVDLDVLKLTALFTARKGPAFATGLLAREAKSYQFEFLRPNSPLFSYFNLLVEQYRRVMHPTQDVLDRVRTMAYGSPDIHTMSPAAAASLRGAGRGGTRLQVLAEVDKRAAWQRWVNERRRVAVDEEKRNRAAFEEIDWNDFVIVGAVEITDADMRAELPPPRSRLELENIAEAKRRMAALVRENKRREEEARAQEQEAQASAAEASAQPAQTAPEIPANADAQEKTAPAVELPQEVPQTVQEPEIPAQPEDAPPDLPDAFSETPDVPRVVDPSVKIRRDYVRTARQTRVQTTTCRVCGSEVPVNEMAEHIRIELLNPKYREERKRLDQRKEEQASVAEGADPSHFLRQFASARTDIFGAQADEEAQSYREEAQRRLAREKEKIVWDGHLNSANTTQNLHARNTALDQKMAQMQQVRRAAAPAAGPAKPGQGAPVAAPAPTPQTVSIAPTGVPAKRAAAGEAPGAPVAQVPRLDSTPATGQRVPRKTDGTLYGESEWLAMNPWPVTLWIRIPDAQHVAPVLDGRTVPLANLVPSATLGSIRDRVQIEMLGRAVGASKLKMWIGGKPATLRQTLASWNLGDVTSLTTILLLLTVFTASYHYPLSRLNCILQIVSVVILLINVCASSGCKLYYLYKIGKSKPHVFPYIGLPLPPSDERWNMAERVFFLLLQSLTTITAHLTNIQYLTLLFPSRLEAKLIIWMLGPLALIQAGFSFANLAPAENTKVRDLGDSIANICQSSLGLLYTVALVIWGGFVNWRRVWRTDGGTAWFGGLSILLATSYTVMSFLFIAYNQIWWFNWVCWSLIVWQSWVGFWWWVSAGMGIGEVEDRQRKEDRRRALERRRARRAQEASRSERSSFSVAIRRIGRRMSGGGAGGVSASGSDDGGSVLPNQQADLRATQATGDDMPLQMLSEVQQETMSTSDAFTTTSSDAHWNMRIVHFLERHQPSAIRARLERLQRAHNAAIRRAAARQAQAQSQTHVGLVNHIPQHTTAAVTFAQGTEQSRPRVRLAGIRRQDRTEY
ncbi:SF3a splicing factor complex subunit [Malassezia cuniculi]|uniref:SF3a splicing factor complex subunit n=1 Tax=Malassezia cuniculi TaxID=948313 RepID=A0AAF0EPT7_9BASI|nr:SF3a splicing factor complex subunit [Malassezia cuniculi]